MYFILSKVLLYFIYPANWILLLLVIALIVKRRKLKRRLFLAAGLVTLIFSCPYLQTVVAIAWDIKTAPLNSRVKYSSAIVLGGFSSEDINGNGFFNTAADRFIQGVRLYETGHVSHVLITSGNASLTPDGFSEGVWVKQQLRDFNLPDSAILIEGKARNTIENAQLSSALLQQKHLSPPYLLVTSAFHMRRALMIFRKQHINVVPYSCNYLNGGAKFSLMALVPDISTLVSWSTYTKEMVGYVVNSRMK